MEKFVKHYKFSLVQNLIDQGRVKPSFHNATLPAQEMGFSKSQLIDVVYNLTPDDFDKSMTLYDDHKNWLDVYKPTVNGIKIYLKFKINYNVLLIISSFKNDDNC
jgi:motility quorum-sensing regulator / GCU-specific mRNA interferase toxin